MGRREDRVSEGRGEASRDKAGRGGVVGGEGRGEAGETSALSNVRGVEGRGGGGYGTVRAVKVVSSTVCPGRRSDRQRPLLGRVAVCVVGDQSNRDLDTHGRGTLSRRPDKGHTSTSRTQYVRAPSTRVRSYRPVAPWERSALAV